MSEHYMQTSLWAEIKSKHGWSSQKIELTGKKVLVYTRKIPIFGVVAYVPGCPFIDKDDVKAFTSEIKRLVKAKIVRIEQFEELDETLERFLESGWKKAKKNIQYRFTVQMDLKPSEKEIFSNLKSRGRYEVKKAQSEGVEINQVDTSKDNFSIMYDLLEVTSKRNKFYIRDLEFMQEYWGTFAKAGKLKLFFAYYNSKIVAGAVVIVNDKKAWYKDGGSLRDGAQVMAPRLLQWEIAKNLKKDGFEVYDLGGIPNPDKHQDSSMHGVYVFKSAYAKKPTIFMPTLDLEIGVLARYFSIIEKQWLRVYNTLRHEFWW